MSPMERWLGMKKVIIFDIDGTLANIEHRRAFVQTKPKNWPAFNRAMVNDTPYIDICWLFRTLAAQGDTTMLIASGRGEEDRAKTVRWLADNHLQYVELYMRPAKDSRSDDIIKYEILEQIRSEHGEPFMVFDDRDQVVNMWRKHGVRCNQVAPGNF
jgi:FMN phosphatase YigB (HAD superfamily)